MNNLYLNIQWRRSALKRYVKLRYVYNKINIVLWKLVDVLKLFFIQIYKRIIMSEIVAEFTGLHLLLPLAIQKLACKLNYA